MSEGDKVDCASLTVKKVVAINNRQPGPGGPKGSYVIVTVDAPNPGVSASLGKTVPQGFNPNILFLDIEATQADGLHPEVITETEARIDLDAYYEEVVVHCNGEAVGGAKFQDVS